MIPKHILPVALELMKFRLPTVQTSIIDANHHITKNGLKLYNQDKKALIEYFKLNHTTESSITENSNVCTVCYHVYDYIEKNYFQENEPLKESVVITNQEEDSDSVFINLEESVKTHQKMKVPTSAQVEKGKDDE